MLAFGPLTSFPLTSLPQGGQTIVVTLTEAATATDIVDVLAVMGATLTEALTATDVYDVPLLHKADFSLRPPVRDWFDRDEWGRFIPGHGIRRG